MEEFQQFDEGPGRRDNSTVNFPQWERYYQMRSCDIVDDAEFEALFNDWNSTFVFAEQFDEEAEELETGETFEAMMLY